MALVALQERRPDGESGSIRHVRGNEANSGHWTISYRQADVSDGQMDRTYPVDTGDFETKGSSCIVGSVQVVAHDQNDVQQFSEQLGILQVGTRFRQQAETLTVSEFVR
jgi:hypothetical protein